MTALIDMLFEMVKAAVGLAAILTVWLVVQSAWRRAFPHAVAEGDDVLAGRLGCHSCTCTEPCERRRRTNTDSED